MVGATVVKNEITAHAVGTTSFHPDVRTILEIGGQDSKIILVENGIAVDYAMNTLCAAGTGAFLSVFDVQLRIFTVLCQTARQQVDIVCFRVGQDRSIQARDLIIVQKGALRASVLPSDANRRPLYGLCRVRPGA